MLRNFLCTRPILRQFSKGTTLHNVPSFLQSFNHITSNTPVTTLSLSQQQIATKKSDKREKLRNEKQEKYEAFVTKDNLQVQDIALNKLKPIPGSKKKRRRVGRGMGSSKGQSAGRGISGQKSRTSVSVPPLFEGGQTPLHRKMPKYGFSNKQFALRYKKVKLETIQMLIDTGRINPEEGTITIKTLRDAGVINNVRWPGIKLLSNGKEIFNAKIDIEVQKASLSAIAAVEKAGGSIRSIYIGKRAMHAILHPEKYGALNKQVTFPAPPPKLYKYYMRPEVRGYLAIPEILDPARDVVPDTEAEKTKARGQALYESQAQKKSKKSKK